MTGYVSIVDRLANNKRSITFENLVNVRFAKSFHLRNCFFLTLKDGISSSYVVTKLVEVHNYQPST